MNGFLLTRSAKAHPLTWWWVWWCGNDLGSGVSTLGGLFTPRQMSFLKLCRWCNLDSLVNFFFFKKWMLMWNSLKNNIFQKYKPISKVPFKNTMWIFIENDSKMRMAQKSVVNEKFTIFAQLLWNWDQNNPLMSR